MFKLHLYNLKEKQSELLSKIREKEKIQENYHKDYNIVEILSTYEIVILSIFLEEKSITESIEILKKLNLFNPEINNILENTKYFKTFNTISLEHNDNIYNFIFNSKGLKYIYMKFIGDKKSSIIEDYMSVLNIDTHIIDNNDFSTLNVIGDDRNLFFNKEIIYYLQMFKISYGLLFYLIKNHIDIIKKYLNVNELEYLKLENINIQNSIRELMATKSKKRWRSNKKMHTLNIFNIIVLNKETIYKNKNKFYILFEDEIYNIKNIYSLKRENIIKIKDKYNRSNETLYIYKDDSKRYIMKTTKSVSKSLYKNLFEVSFSEYIQKEILNE